MSTKKAILILSVLFVTCIQVMSQDKVTASKADMRKILNDADERKIEKAGKLERKIQRSKARAKKYFDKAKKFEQKYKKKKKSRFERKYKKFEQKGIDETREAVNYSSQMHKIIFDVYKANFKRAKDKSNAFNIPMGEKLEKEAEEFMQQARSIQSSLKMIKEKDDLLESMDLITKLEQKAIAKQLAAYGVYFSKEEIIDEDKAAWEEAMSVHTIEAYEKYIQDFPSGKYVNLAKQEMEKLQEMQAENRAWHLATQRNTISSYQVYLNDFPAGRYVNQAKAAIENLRKRREQSNQIVFKVQVLALSETPISENKLQQILQTSHSIEKEEAGGWYKYSIGSFSSYNEAKDYKLNLSVDDAFVVAYKNGVRISIEEAIELTKN